MIVKSFTNGPLQENCYLAIDEESREAAVIDPGSQADDLIAWIKSFDCQIKYLLNTHGHSDHIGANDAICQTFDVNIGIDTLDLPFLTNPELNLSAYSGLPFTCQAQAYCFSEKEPLLLGKKEIAILRTPGHTPGGVCFLADNVLLAGDTLFAGSIGRTDLPGGSMEKMRESLREKILPLSDAIIVYPGHGPQTSIGEEKRYNPYLVQ